MAGRFGLVFGGCGALGKAVVNQLSKEGFKAISIDLLNNADAYNNILVRPSWSLHEQSTVIRDGLDDILGFFNSYFSRFSVFSKYSFPQARTKCQMFSAPRAAGKGGLFATQISCR